MAHTVNPYETSRAIAGLVQTNSTDCTIVITLDAWIGLDAIDAPVTYHNWGLIGDSEHVTVSATDSFNEWVMTSDDVVDIHIANAVRTERSVGTRMAISDGMSRGITTAPVKAAWKACWSLK